MKRLVSPLTVAVLPILLLGLAAPLEADKGDGRMMVKQFNFNFEPAPGDLGIGALKICILTPINSASVEKHTRNTAKAFRNLEPEETSRVAGIRFTSGGKPQTRMVTPEPFEQLIERSLGEELQALGMEVLPTMAPPSDLRTKTLLGVLDELSGPAPDILLAMEIEDFFFETTPGMWKLKMETFFALDVRVMDVAGRELLWEGTIDVGELEKKGMFMGREAVDTRANQAFRDLIEAVLRHNDELRRELQAMAAG